MLAPRPLFRTAAECEGLPSGELDQDQALGRKEGDRLPASYVNFYLPNGGVLVPQFGGDNADRDEAALCLLRQHFPARRVVGFPFSRQILLGGGNIHCVTMQQPLAS